MRRLRWFWVGGLVALLGVAAAAVWAVAGVSAAVGAPDHFTRGAVPGTMAVQLAAGEDQVIYYEGPGTPTAGDLGLQVTGPDGTPIGTPAYRGDLRYDTAGGAGRAVATLRPGSAGTYQISTTADLGTGATVAIGASVARTATYGLIGPALVAAAAVVLGLVCAAVPFTRPVLTR
jgi:hypothetical protein